MSENLNDLIDARVAELLGGVAQQPVSLESVLRSIDPRDSDAALALWGWLQQNGRIHKMGTIDGVGYIYAYQEPKGSSREGYTAGGTTGDRIVEEALSSAKAEGVKKQTGICSACFSVIVQAEGESVPSLQEVDEGVDPTVCTSGDSHHFA